MYKIHIKTMIKVKDFNWTNQKLKRAGIIPYTFHNNIKLFAFGIDGAIASITDFGGHFEKQKDRDRLDTAIREYHEECHDIFGKLDRDMLQNCDVLEGTDTAEILLPVDNKFLDFTKNFSKLPKQSDEEINNIFWLTKSQLITILDSQHVTSNGTKPFIMYYRILDTLNSYRSIL